MYKFVFLILFIILFKPANVKSEQIAFLGKANLKFTYHKYSRSLNDCTFAAHVGRPCKKLSFWINRTSFSQGLKHSGKCSRQGSYQKCTWSQDGKKFKITLHKEKGLMGGIERNIYGTISGSSIRGTLHTKNGVFNFLGSISPSSYLTLNTKKIDENKKIIEELENEKQKIAEEKRRIEKEKQKIADAKKKIEQEQNQKEAEKKKKEADSKLYIIGSGTGFFVSAEGHIVSNDHVVGICRKVASKIKGQIEFFNVLKTDEVNDLGIIKGEYKNPTYLSIKSGGAEYGEDIVAFGYPLADALSTSVKLTRGIVSSLSGPGNNYSEIQIDAAIQPGNSGGPVLNLEGQVVGVASSGLNKLYMLEQSEYIPENVNFAVAAPTLSNFLKANGVKVDTRKFEINNTKELARIGRPATLQLFCMNTKTVFEELKKTKKHSDVLFEKVIDLK